MSTSTSMSISIPAAPFDYRLAPGATALVVIDMQRDFIEPGGFGASLGNDVSLLVPAIAPIAALLAAWRARGWPVVHTREAHKADLSD
ncbi:isochorismatase family protein, partial [Methylibium sp. T29]